MIGIRLKFMLFIGYFQMVAIGSMGQNPEKGASRYQIKTIIDSLPQQSVGGLATDAMGFLYSADFSDRIWRINPYTQEVRVFAEGLYGTSGNCFDSRGNLFQSNIAGNFISKIDRNGNGAVFADSLVYGPVGIVANSLDELFVCNCHANSIARISTTGATSIFVSSANFQCPNGITVDNQDNLYVVSFGNNEVYKIDKEGEIQLLARTPGKIGNGHIAIFKGRIYVTGFHGHQVYVLDMSGQLLATIGTGKKGTKDGTIDGSEFSYPNGIAVDPDGKYLYVNEMSGEIRNPVITPGKGSIRAIKVTSIADLMENRIRTEGFRDLDKYYKGLKASMFDEENTGSDMNALGYHYMVTGEHKTAERLFRLNIESYPANVPAYAYRARNMYLMGNITMARKYYEKALQINPSSKSLKKRLESLENE